MLTRWLLDATPAPLPNQEGLTDVTPGIVGFSFIFGLAAVVTLLMFSLTRHIRRIDFNAKVAERERAAAERAAADDTTAPNAGTTP